MAAQDVRKEKAHRSLAHGCTTRPAFLTVLLLIALLPMPLFGQDGGQEEKSPLTVGGYRLSGTTAVGYRLVEIDGGQKNFYREVIDVDEGLRLFDFMLRGERTESVPFLVDRFSIAATHIGDPNYRIDLSAAKDDVYKFTATFRHSEFFVNRFDDALSDNYDFNVERRFGDVHLTLFPSKPLQVHLFYRRLERDGSSMVPRLLENNVFVLPATPDETTDEVGAAVDLSTRHIDVRLEQSYRHVDDDGRVVLPAAGLQGLRSDAPFANMRLNTFREERNQEVDTWITRLRLRATLTPRWEVTQGYVFARSLTTSRLRTTASGLGRAGTAGANEEFTAVSTGHGETTSDVHIVDFGTSYALRTNLLWHVDYRFHLLDQDGQGILETQRSGFLTGLTLFRESGRQAVRTRAHTLSTSFEWLPLPRLTLQIGYRYQLRDVAVNQLANGLPLLDDPLAAAPQLDTTTQSHGVIVNADWHYRDLLQASVKFVGDYFDNPYTRISPTRDDRIRIRVRLSPVPWLALSETFSLTDLDNPDTGTSTLSKTWTTGLVLQPREWLNLDASLSLADLDHQSRTVISVDAVPTPTTFTNNANILSYSIGGTLDVVPNVQTKAYATWTRVHGEGRSSYFFAGGAVSYFWKQRNLHLTARYERPYVIEREPPRDRFFAHIVTFILRQDF